MKKMCNINNRWADVNHNHKATPSHNEQNGHHQKSTSKKTGPENNKYFKIWRQQNLYILLVEMWNGAAVKESSTWVPQNLKTELQYDPAIPLLGIYSQIIEVKVLKRCLYSYVPSSIICNSQCRRNPSAHQQMNG